MTTYVLVHGAWDGGWMWQPVRRRLIAARADVYTPSLTGSGHRVHLAGPHVGLATYLADVENLLVYEQLEQVVLVGFSFSGVVVTGVAARVPERIGHLVYVDAFVPREGQALADLISDEALVRFRREARTRGEGWAIPPPAESDPRATALPLRVVVEPLPPEAAPTRLRRSYVRCVLNRDGGAFDDAGARARREGWGYYELESGHHPMRDVPDDLTALLLSLGEPLRPPP